MGKILTKKDIRSMVENNLKYANKQNIVDTLKYNGIKFKRSLNQSQLIEIILDNKIDMWNIYTYLEDKDLGLHPSEVEKILDINKTIRKKLEKENILKVAYTKGNRAYGRTIETPYYSLFSLYNLTHEKLNDWVSSNYRKPTQKALEGYKKAQETKLKNESIKQLKSEYDDYKYWQYKFKELLNNEKYVILDTESTGLEGYDKIVDIAIIDPQGNTLFESLVNPEMKISAASSEIHGLYEKDVVNSPAFNDIKDTIRDILKDKIMITYNAEFD